MPEGWKASKLKMRPKRSSHQEDPIQQPAAKRARIQAQQHGDDLDLGGWLRHAEVRCIRVGNLKSKMEMERVRMLEIMSRWKQEETKSKSLRDEDLLVGTGVKMETLLVVQHQHAGAEDTHVQEVLQSCELNTTIVEDTPVCEVLVVRNKNEDPHMDVVLSEDPQETEHERVRAEDTTETYTAVTEDTHIHEMLQSRDRKEDPHVVETHLDISRLNTTIVEDTPVCEVQQE